MIIALMLQKLRFSRVSRVGKNVYFLGTWPICKDASLFIIFRKSVDILIQHSKHAKFNRPSFLRSSITLELLSELLTLFEESYLLGSFFVPVPVILMLATSN